VRFDTGIIFLLKLNSCIYMDSEEWPLYLPPNLSVDPCPSLPSYLGGFRDLVELGMGARVPRAFPWLRNRRSRYWPVASSQCR